MSSLVDRHAFIAAMTDSWRRYKNTGSDAMTAAWALLADTFNSRAAGEAERAAVFAGPLGSGKTLGAVTYAAMLPPDAGLIVTRRIAQAIEVEDAGPVRNPWGAAGRGVPRFAMVCTPSSAKFLSHRARQAMIPKSAVYLLLAVSLLLFLPKLGMPLLDPDEGLYAEIAREMVTRGDWVIPHVNGLPYLEKPPLYFWLTASAFRLLGPSEWATRLWSAMSALGTVLLTWRIGRRLYGAQAGLLAGVVVATVVGNALYVRRASTDQLFVFCLTLAMYGFLRDAERPDRGRARFLFVYVGAALSVLAKGFIGLVFPVLIIGLGLLVVRRFARPSMSLGWRELNLARGLAVFAAIAVPWHVLVAWRSPMLFNFYVVDNHLLRFLNARRYVEDDVPSSTLAFLVASFLWAFPWGVFALARCGADTSRGAQDLPRPELGSWRHARWRPVILIWLVAIVGLFAASRFKHEYYALPAFPALAVLVGAAWASGRDIGRWLVIGLVGCGAVGAWALWTGAALTPAQALTGLAELNAYYRILRNQGAGLPFESARPFGELLEWLGIVLIVGWGLATLCWFRAWRRGAFVALVGVAGVITVLIFRLLDVVEPIHSVKETARALVAEAGPTDLLVVEGTLEYSPALPFYTGRQFSMVNGALNYFSIAASLPEAEGLFLNTAELIRLWEGPRRVFLVVRRPRAQSVVAALPAARVHELGRYGSRWLYSNRWGPLIHVNIHSNSTEISTRDRRPRGTSRNESVSQM